MPSCLQHIPNMSPCNVTFFGQIDAATDDMCNFANYHAGMFVVFGVMTAVSLVGTALLFVCNGCTVTDSVEWCAKTVVVYLFLTFGLESSLVFLYVVMVVLFVCVPVRDVLARCFPRGVVGVETEPVTNTPIIIETAPAVVDNESIVLDIVAEPVTNPPIIIETAPAVADTESIVLDIVAELPESSTECTICLDLIGSSVMLKTKCNHEFHLACIAKWPMNTCPNCRAPLDP